MKTEDIKRILIVGGGTMGSQIALQFAVHGCEIVVYDIREEALAKSLASIRKMAASLMRQQLLSRDDAEAAVGRITTTIDPEAAADIDLVSESAPEDPVLKGEIFSLFHRLCPERTIFTTNTSTLLPSMFAAASGRPERLLALHFHDLRISNVVDIMPHRATDEQVVELVQAFAKRMGLAPIMMKKESSGYIFNAMFGALLLSAQTLAANQIASIEDIDRAWMGVMKMPIGPFGMMDNVGLDTVWKITDYWGKRSGNEQQLQNAAFLRQYVDRGDLGQKSGKGFYAYPQPSFLEPGFNEGK
ncbi:MAG TPA: 3-hydroxyacyl-CoA dehydrogenase [Syntrophus sp. (in: bacteria)]|nr:3-hydroxyacyl-CoA dehydrogenase [Syntrophus sp. (in: bacteria)]